MNILFSIFSTPTGMYGSCTRMLSLAKKFKSEGHNVYFTASGKTAEMLLRKRYNVYYMQCPTILGLPKSISDRLSYKSQRISLPAKEGKSKGNIWLLYIFAGYAKNKFLEESIQMMIDICNKAKPDCIITELDLSAYTTAFIKDIPLISTYAKISKKDLGGYFSRKILRVVRRCARSYTHNKVFDFDYLFGDTTLKLIPSIPQLDGTKESADICYCGNLLEPVVDSKCTFKAENNKKYIFCYFGTGSISLDIIEKHLPQVLKNTKDIICYVAAQSIKEDYSIGNV